MSGLQGYACVGLLKNQSADESLSQWIDVRGRTHLVFYITGTGTTSSGVITLDEMLPLYDPLNNNREEQPYGGTPSAITTVNASTVSGDNQSAIHVAVGAYGFVRARISTAVGGGGSISVGLVAV